MTAYERPRGKRVVITKLERTTVAAVELFTITEAVAADGRLSASELEQLVAWSDRHRDAALPAREHIAGVISNVLEDGVATPEELRDLYLAIEAALPEELRRKVKLKRQGAERADALRDAPVESWNFMVAGVHHEGRWGHLDLETDTATSVALVREPRNAFSASAVAVHLKRGGHLGYVPEQMAGEMAPHLDRGSRYDAYITKILTGGRVPIPVVQVEVYRADAQVDGLDVAVHATERAGTGVPTGPSVGWTLFILAAVLATVALVMLS